MNIAAVIMLLLSLHYVTRPPDGTYPYGHGKVESFAASVEGSLIMLAGLFILIEAVGDMIRGHQLRSLDIGLIIILGAAAANGFLGLYLLKTGKKHRSPLWRMPSLF